ncbi:MAG: Sbal_3080 family lipoprotein [Nitrospinales bacterium]
MKKIFWCVFVLTFLVGCSSPKFSGSAINNLSAKNDQGNQVKGIDNSNEIVIINDSETREGFQVAMENWLKSHDYKFTVAQDNAEHVEDKINLVYVGIWSWDLAIYLADARILAFYNGEQVGHAEYNVRTYFNLSFSKFGSGEKRIFKMMDNLFGVETPEGAEQIN